jgi:hypothetical protein
MLDVGTPHPAPISAAVVSAGLHAFGFACRAGVWIESRERIARAMWLEFIACTEVVREALSHPTTMHRTGGDGDCR